jgi:tetratricopeptide (TPR) repeat protein
MTHRTRTTAFLLAAAGSFAACTAVFASSVADSRSASLALDKEIGTLRAEAAAAPGDPCPLNELGVALARRAYYDEAVDAFERSLDLRPDPIVWNNLGSVHLTRGRLGPAGSAFRNALELDTNYALAHYNLGAVYDARRDESNAVEHYKRALELDPKLDDPAVNPAILNNHYLLTVRTRRYLDTVGALGLPMQAQCTAPLPASLASPGAPPPEETKGRGWWIFRKKEGKNPPPEPPPAPKPTGPAEPTAVDPPDDGE